MTCARFIFLGLWAGVVVYGADGEKSPNDTITTTRRELEALKTERAGVGGPQKLTLPNLDTPIIPSPVRAEPVLSKKKQDELKAKSKSSGWLIDAMEKNARTSRDSTTTGKDEIDSSEEETTLNGLRDENLDSATGLANPRNSRTRERAESREAKSLKEEGINPLAGFMASWMTPRDYELLQKSPGFNTTSDNSSFAVPSSSAGLGVPDAGGMLRHLGRSNADPAMGSSRNPAINSPENPYLSSSLNLQPDTAPAMRELSLPPSVAAPAPATSAGSPAINYEPAPGSRTAPFVPEKLKRPDDAKYFPQLKRF